MTKAFIWDLDGTLLDSYDAILAGLEETYMYYGLDFDRPAIHAYILQHSVQKLLEKVAAKKGLDAEEMNCFRGQSLQEKNAHIQLMDGAKAILDWAQKADIQQFVYTHKGKNKNRKTGKKDIEQIAQKTDIHRHARVASCSNQGA
jgi:phosphoglycolate phosphatase-like HAD superfamily hydrolase